MAWLSSQLLIYTYSLTLLTISYILLTSPSAILSASPIWVLGESMHIRPPASNTRIGSSDWTSSPSEPIAALALILALGASMQAFFAGGLTPISEVSSVSGRSSQGDKDAALREVGEKVYALRTVQNQWMGLAGVRVVLLGVLLGWMYVFQSERRDGFGMLSAPPPTKGFGLLANRVVFTAAMTDMLVWGYVWTVLREEGGDVMKMIATLRAEDDEE